MLLDRALENQPSSDQDGTEVRVVLPGTDLNSQTWKLFLGPASLLFIVTLRLESLSASFI